MQSSPPIKSVLVLRSVPTQMRHILSKETSNLVFHTYSSRFLNVECSGYAEVFSQLNAFKTNNYRQKIHSWWVHLQQHVRAAGGSSQVSSLKNSLNWLV